MGERQTLGIFAIFATAACSSGPESPSACVDRFSEGSEMIEFLDNEIFGANYTYEIDDFDVFSKLHQKEALGEDETGAQFHIRDGKSYMTINRVVPSDEGAILFGCRSAPENTRLVKIQRERLVRENED